MKAIATFLPFSLPAQFRFMATSQCFVCHRCWGLELLYSSDPLVRNTSGGKHCNSFCVSYCWWTCYVYLFAASQLYGQAGRFSLGHTGLVTEVLGLHTGQNFWPEGGYPDWCNLAAFQGGGETTQFLLEKLKKKKKIKNHVFFQLQLSVAL